jgi:hypothetical protein
MMGVVKSGCLKEGGGKGKEHTLLSIRVLTENFKFVLIWVSKPV